MISGAITEPLDQTSFKAGRILAPITQMNKPLCLVRVAILGFFLAPLLRGLGTREWGSKLSWAWRTTGTQRVGMDYSPSVTKYEKRLRLER